jgi:hypothetical protein
MARDLYAKLADGVDVTNANGTYTNRAGSWTWILDVPTASADRATPRSGTMLVADWARLGVVQFTLFHQGVSLGGGVDPTSVNIHVFIEEADDTSGTNARPVCQFVMGTGASTATPSGAALTVAADSTTKQQYTQVGIVRKPALRYNTTITLNAGTTPSAVLENLTIYAQGMGVDVFYPLAADE